MDEKELKARTKMFALGIIRMVDNLPRSRTGAVLGDQLLRAATSVGANYRAACRGRSPADFIAKMGIVVEEADECIYWLELIQEAGLLPAEQTAPFAKEADELTAIFTASLKTAKHNLKSRI